MWDLSSYTSAAERLPSEMGAKLTFHNSTIDERPRVERVPSIGFLERQWILF